MERIHDELRALTEAVTRLVVLEERQGTQAKRLDKLESRQDEMGLLVATQERELSKWVNRGIGLWGAAMALWAVFNSPTVRAIVGGG